MKKKLWPRVLTAITGVLMILVAALILVETFLRTPISAAWNQLLAARTPLSVLLALIIALGAAVLGVSCCISLIPAKTKKRGYVMQKGDDGAIGVSVKSIQGLVQTCVRQYPEIHQAEIAVQEKRDGIAILLTIEETAGVNIPMIVSALQKQVKQYVNDCTGVNVREVRVLVENSEEELALLTAPAAQPVPAQTELPMEAVEEESSAYAEEEAYIPAEDMAEEEAEAPAEEAPAVPAAVPVAMPPMPAMPDEADDRPLHQRLFGTEEQPAFVPAPPELVIQPVDEVLAETEEAVEEAVEEASAEVAEEIPIADVIQEDAVAEVAQAIAMEEAAEETAQDEE